MAQHEVEQLALWAAMTQNGTDLQRAFVMTLVDKAAPLLDRVVETFPTYTLHNRLHARNVANLMASLLGPRLGDLSSLEAALLILAAYFHDVGMAFTEEERKSLKREPDWEEFLGIYPEAFIASEGSDELPTYVAEMYCRWGHADRVFKFLNALEPKLLKWGVVNIREELGELCRSHNMEAAEMHSSKALTKTFLESADLRFCAIILRLADILDFDRSRSPEAVYKYLGLQRRSTARESVSDVEWLKHLNSDGMIFPSRRDKPYEEGFICGPDHPAVEHDVRRFLDTIDHELAQCREILSECSDKWRNHPLPLRVNRDNIKGSGYRYGEYTFKLDQDNILNLLMGENLYDSPFVFVRELLQNCIDTSRLRQHLERARGNIHFSVKPIIVTEWIDRDSYRWVRFDDFGMGMDEQIIRDYLLRVGVSYYNSPQYKADLLKARRNTAKPFVPISRFGIGLLSCFIACDRVEINTLRQLPDGAAGVPARMSLPGLQGYFAVQTPMLPPAGMPCRGQQRWETAYRTEFGTSIACRFDPAKEHGNFDLARLLSSNLFCPVVPVEYDGLRVGGQFEEIIERPWCRRGEIKLDAGQLRAVSSASFIDLRPADIVLEMCPLDLSKSAITEEFKGQLVLLRTVLSSRVARVLDGINSLSGVAASIQFQFDITKNLIMVAVSNSLKRSVSIDKLRYEVSHMGGDERYGRVLNKYLDRLEGGIREGGYNRHSDESEFTFESNVAVEQAQSMLEPAVMERLHGKRLRMAHNGIIVPTRAAGSESWLSDEITLALSRNASDVSYDGNRSVIGALALQDSMRPNLSLARSSVRSWPWEMLSTADLTLGRVIEGASIEGLSAPVHLFRTTARSREYITLGRLMNDPLLAPDGMWKNEKVFLVGSPGRYASLDEVLSMIQSGQDVHLDRIVMPNEVNGASYGVDFGWSVAAAALASAYLELRYVVEKYQSKVLAVGRRNGPVQEGERLFPPVAFASYVDSDAFQLGSVVMNRDHAFSRWLLSEGPEISKRYPGIMDGLRSKMLKRDYGITKSERLADIMNLIGRLVELEPRFGLSKAAVLTEKDL